MTDLKYIHTDEARSAIKTAIALNLPAGRIVIPTGGGKTGVEARTIRAAINGTSDFNVHIVLAPRIQLLNQLFSEYRKYIGQGYSAVLFHSGHYEVENDKEIQELPREERRLRYAEFDGTTSVDEVRHRITEARDKHKRDLVIFSTYHSCGKLAKLNLNFKTLIADESQYCVGEKFFSSILSLNAEIKLFFTATERHIENAKDDMFRGLNNETVFGPVLYQISPQTLIERGTIVAPALHVVAAQRHRANDMTLIDEINNIVEGQLNLSHTMPVRKIVFAMEGTLQVGKVIDNMDEIKARFPDFDIFTIVSNQNRGAQVNGEKKSRSKFMSLLANSTNALIFHYDILSEGIDIDGITGVALMRNMQKAKMLQTIGRALRRYQANESLKTHAWVSVMQIDGDDASRANVQNILHELYNGGFDINVENIVLSDEGQSEEDKADRKGRNPGPDRKKRREALLASVRHDLEAFALQQQISNAVSLDELPF